ncbi:putative two-component response regulator ARR21 isoform X2 [Eutrema salsugineum]|uniref:putative two-component response regulator ARR21 isoform X2 n=1 Tax=Eutrema salsugineum TaxID=72664 RepID=UPI000CECE670|nr:putative two-component response regulator ARR21 isoform X2 [Eutrema salsugineum]
MAFAQSFYNQNSGLRISVMVVDDDPVFLQIMSRMLEKSKYRDPSIMEITVIAVKDSREALSTLQIQRNNIDLIVTDYYMPGMNGLQLKKEITREFGNLPVIVISSDSNKEQESLTCGAMCFIPKPIKATDLTKIYQLAITYKRNGKSILWTEHNHQDTDHVTIPQQIQLLPEQANVLKTKKKRKFSPRSVPRSLNSSNGSCVSTDGSRKNRKRSGDDVESLSKPAKKSKISWSDYLHDLFLQAIRHIGLDKAVPKKILEFMNVDYLTRENVASHLQKYRQFLRKVAERGVCCSSMLSGRGIDSIFAYAHITEPYYNNYTATTSWYDTSLNNRSFYSKPGHGFGQSRLLSNPREPIRSNQMPYNYMNRSSTYQPLRNGSSLTLPISGNLNFPTQPSENGGRRSFFESTGVANYTGQTSQVLGFGQHGPLAINDNNFENNTVSSCGSLTPNQPGSVSHGSLTPNKSDLSSHGSFNPNHQGNSSHGSLSTSNQPGMSSYGSSTSNQPGISSHGSLTPNQPGLTSHGSLTSNHLGMSFYGDSTPNLPTMNSYESLTSNPQGLNSYGCVTPNPGLNNVGSLTPNPGLNNVGSSTPNQPGASHLLYGIELFLNNENTASMPQPHANATTEPNLGIPELENLSLYDDLGNINELPCDISNFQLDNNKPQEEAVSTTQFELPASFPTELNEIFSPGEEGDWTFVNINQGHSDGETSNIFAAPETNSPIININPNQIQERDDPDFIDWSLLDPQDLANEFDFMDSLFNNDMN